MQFGLIFKEKTIGQKELNFWWKTIKKGLHGKREEIIIKEDYWIEINLWNFEKDLKNEEKKNKSKKPTSVTSVLKVAKWR